MISVNLYNNFDIIRYFFNNKNLYYEVFKKRLGIMNSSYSNVVLYNTKDFRGKIEVHKSY